MQLGHNDHYAPSFTPQIRKPLFPLHFPQLFYFAIHNVNQMW